MITEPPDNPASAIPTHASATRAQEIKALLLLTAVVAPLLAVAIVGGYGFFVWMYQLITGSLPGA